MGTLDAAINTIVDGYIGWLIGCYENFWLDLDAYCDEIARVGDVLQRQRLTVALGKVAAQFPGFFTGILA